MMTCFRSTYLLLLWSVIACMLGYDEVSGFQTIVKPTTICMGKQTMPRTVKQQITLLRSSKSEDEEETTNYDNEEILLQIHLATLPDVSIEDAKEQVSRYTQSFPFAAVLPVQPLQYLPAPDGGVDVRFLRKKTKEKGSLDGGLRFFLSEDRDGIDLTVKRNSVGQTIPKMFAEKLVVQAFVKGISGEEDGKASPPPTDVVTVESVFHKWLQVN